MEVKKKSLYGFFLRYTVQVVINTLLILGLLVFLVTFLGMAGIVLPANYAEVELKENEEKFFQADRITEDMIPPHCTYGVYAEDGTWQYGDFLEEARGEIWENYTEDIKYAKDGGYYRFMNRYNGEVCIVKYRLRAYFTGNHPVLNRFGPETMLPVIFILLFFLQVILTSGIFSKRLRKRLEILNEATEKISSNDLNFEKKESDIKEIEEILESLNHLKSALKKSLETQWEMEEKREKELSALTHDIKTPVTIIKGNAELLEEDTLTGDQRECSNAILKNVEQIEMYLESMRQVIHNVPKKEKREILKGQNLAEAFISQAEEIASAGNTKLHIKQENVDCILKGDREALLRAWENLVGNAVSYTDKEKGICILIDIREKEGNSFFVAGVCDYGPGFSKEDLRYGTERFYTGDKSRHGCNHQGLGLFIASGMAKEQGGSLVLKNSEVTGGACAELWLLNLILENPYNCGTL